MKTRHGEVYRIVVKGELDENWSMWLSGFNLSLQMAPDGNRLTALTGAVTDQAALRSILIKIWDMNLELIALQRMDENGN